MTWGPTDSAWRPPEQGAAGGAGGVAEEVEGYADLVEIGRGGDSIVFRGRDLSMRRDVAIKVLLVEDDERAQRFAREVEITLDLGRQHPNIVTVLAVATTRSGKPAIVMDFHEGGTLHDRLRSHGPMPVEEVVRIGEVVADALAFAHARGVLHRDVKPQNVLVLPTSWVLADFGIARLADSEHTSSAETFTYRHAAPQVLDGYPPTAADDVWSLGSTLFTLLDGRPPFASDDPHDDSALAYLRRARTEPHRRLDAPGAGRLAAVVDRCLQKRVEDRWAGAAELRDALAALRASAWEPEPGPDALPLSPGGLLGAPDRPPAREDDGAVTDGTDSTDGAWAWRPAPAPASPVAPPPDDRTAPRHGPRAGSPPVPGEVPAEVHAPPVEPVPVALSVAGRAPVVADAEATGRGPAPSGPGEVAAQPGPGTPGAADGEPPHRRRPSVLLLAAVLVVGLLLGVGGFVLRQVAGGDDVDPDADPTTGVQAVPTLAAEPTDASPLRDAPDPDLAFVFTTIQPQPDGLTVAWEPVDEADVDRYVLFQQGDDETAPPVAILPATSREETVPIVVPTQRTCFYLAVFLVDGSYGLSNQRCARRG